MSNKQRPYTPPPAKPILTHYHAVDLGCRASGIGSVTVWRSIKAISQLVVITFCFWSALSGALAPTVAFVGMLLAYLGAEGIEAALAAAGRASFDVTFPEERSEQERDEEKRTDGGVVVEARRKHE